MASLCMLLVGMFLGRRAEADVSPRQEEEVPLLTIREKKKTMADPTSPEATSNETNLKRSGWCVPLLAGYHSEY